MKSRCADPTEALARSKVKIKIPYNCEKMTSFSDTQLLTDVPEHV